MATAVEKTYTHTCDICGQVKERGELRQVQVEAWLADFCRTCMSTPLDAVLTTLRIPGTHAVPVSDPVPA